MHINEFRKLLAQVTDLTHDQCQQLNKSIEDSENSEEIIVLLEKKLTSNPQCPHCEHDQISPWGTSSGLQRYRCQECKATFNVLTGTPLARLRNKEKWLDYAKTLAEGQSVRKAAKICGVHKNTTFRWRHRFLELIEGEKPSKLKGIVEADETFFRKSFKGKKRGMTRPARKRGSKAKKRGTSDEHEAVLIIRDRSGATTEKILKNTKTEEISEALKPLLDNDAVLCSDGAAAYRLFAEKEGITLKAVNLTAGIRVVEKVFHIQNVNAYDSRLKEWMRRFHGVATSYLKNYLGWRRLIERESRSPAPKRIIWSALGMREQQLMVT
jgi:transposase-like protein